MEFGLKSKRSGKDKTNCLLNEIAQLELERKVVVSENQHLRSTLQGLQGRKKITANQRSGNHTNVRMEKGTLGLASASGLSKKAKKPDKSTPCSTHSTVLKSGTELEVEKILPEPEPKADKIIPDSQLEVDKLLPEGELEVDKIIPEDELAGDKLNPEGELEVEKIIPEGEPEVEKIIPEGGLAEDQLIPEPEPEADKIIPEGELEVEKIIPEGGLEEDQLIPEPEPEAEKIISDSQLEVDKLIPEPEPEAEKIISEPQMEVDELLPEGELEVDKIIPEGGLEEDQLIPEPEPEADKIIPEGELEVEKIIPEGGLEEDQLIPEPEPETDKIVPKRELNINIQYNNVSGKLDTNLIPYALSYEAMDLNKELVNVFKQLGYEKPTVLHQYAVAACYSRINFIMDAPFGNKLGKKLVLAVACLQAVIRENKSCQAILVTATREKAKKLHHVINKACQRLKVTCHLCIGGTSVVEDKRKLAVPSQILVGTPGRIYDMLITKHLKVDAVNTVVLDKGHILFRLDHIDFTRKILRYFYKPRIIVSTIRMTDDVQKGMNSDHVLIQISLPKCSNDTLGKVEVMPLKPQQRKAAQVSPNKTFWDITENERQLMQTIHHFSWGGEKSSSKKACILKVIDFMKIQKAVIIGKNVDSLGEVKKSLEQCGKHVFFLDELATEDQVRTLQKFQDSTSAIMVASEEMILEHDNFELRSPYVIHVRAPVSAEAFFRRCRIAAGGKSIIVSEASNGNVSRCCIRLFEEIYGIKTVKLFIVGKRESNESGKKKKIGKV